MLEFLRRQSKPIMTALAIIIIIAFVFWGGSAKTGANGRGNGPDETAFTISGKEYSFSDKARYDRYFELARQMGMYDFLRTLIRANQKYVTQDRVPLDFVLNLLVLREELEKSGIRASDEEVKAEFKKLPAFMNRTTGEFDAAQAETFEQSLGTMGMRTSDVYDVIRDSIGLKKLQRLVSGNYQASKHVADQFYRATYQTVKSASIDFPLDTYKKSAQVSDEEVSKYYEQKKDEFKSPEKRAVSYVFLAKPKDEEPKPAADGKKPEEKKPVSEEERRKRENDFSTKVNDFSLATIKPDAKFEDAAKEFKLEVKTLPAFSADAAPEAIKNESNLISEIFHNIPSTHPVSDPVEGQEGYYIFKVTSVEEPKQLELKEVSTKIKDALITQKAQEAMTKAASEAKKSIEEAVKAGKKFEDVVKEQKLESKAVAEFSPNDPPKDASTPRELTSEIEKTGVGKFTAPLTTDKGLALYFVTAKELRKREDSAKLKEDMINGYNDYSQGTIFHAWFKKCFDNAKIDPGPLAQRSVAVK
jgi:hypothetical protein